MWYVTTKRVSNDRPEITSAFDSLVEAQNFLRSYAALVGIIIDSSDIGFEYDNADVHTTVRIHINRGLTRA